MNAGEIAIAAATGVGAGILAGILGTGGGVLTVPVMVLFLDRSQVLAQGTSLLAIVATAGMGTYGNSRRRRMPWPTVARMVAGGAVGAVAGASLALHVADEVTLRRMFGAFLLFTAWRMFRGKREVRA